MFRQGTINDVIVRRLVKFEDERGWLAELFRHDELDAAFVPVMAYISMTRSGVARGPHEHREQADHFAFLGPSNFRIYLWDNRPASPTYGTKQIIDAGENAPQSVIIPPGVVHAYKNVGKTLGMVINLPNQLYAGQGKRDPVDEVRHERDPHTPFVLD